MTIQIAERSASVRLVVVGKLLPHTAHSLHRRRCHMPIICYRNDLSPRQSCQGSLTPQGADSHCCFVGRVPMTVRHLEEDPAVPHVAESVQRPALRAVVVLQRNGLQRHRITVAGAAVTVTNGRCGSPRTIGSYDSAPLSGQ